MNGPTTSHTLLRDMRDPARAETAWERFHSGYYGPLESECRRKGLDAATAEDVAQRIALRLIIKDLGGYRAEKGGFRNFLRGMVRTEISNHYRTRTRRPGDFGRGAGADDGADEPAALWYDEKADAISGGLEPLIERDLRAIVAAVKARVGASTWRCYELRAGDGRPVKEIAAELGMTANAVSVAVNRVKRMLAEENPPDAAEGAG